VVYLHALFLPLISYITSICNTQGSGDARVLIWRSDRLASPLRALQLDGVPSGITCLSLQPEEGQLLLGTEGGLAVRCQDQKLAYNILSDQNLSG
jgi:hypothetical protein